MSLYTPSTHASQSIFVLPVVKTAGKANIPVASSSNYAAMIQRVKVAGTPVKPLGVTNSDRTANQLQPILSPTAFELQARLRARWPAVMARAQQLQKSTVDPVQSIIELLGNLPGDYATWREILEEPYG